MQVQEGSYPGLHCGGAEDSTQLGGTEEVAVVVSVVPSGAGVEGIKMAGTDAT